MAYLTLNGPVVPRGTHNMVLREALLSSPIQRLPSPSSYHIIEVGVREGVYTTWIGTWSQIEQKVDGASPTSILDAGRPGMRLKENQALVVRIATVGTPASLVGSRINFRLALVGGRDGTALPLVASGAAIADVNSRTAIAALEKQINTGGLADWEDPVALQDPSGGEVYDSYSSSNHTVTAAAAVAAGLVSVTVVVPSGETRLVMVTGDGTVQGAGGATVLNAWIYDGTTDHNGATVAAANAVLTGFSLAYAVKITATTVFSLRFTCTTTNATVNPHAIHALAMR